MTMDSFMSIAITMQVCFSVVLCKADNFIYGISEQDSFKKSFDEAIRFLNNNSSNTFIQINPSQGLRQILETGLTFTSALQQHSQNNVFLFTDLNNQQSGIIREVLEFQSKNKANANVTIQLDNSFGSQSKVQQQTQEVDALFKYLNRLLSPTKGLSVVVDDSQLGHDAFIQIIQKFSESGREIAGHYILKGEVTEESVLAFNLYKSNSLFSGIEHITFLKVVNMTQEMGLTSINENLRMFITKRSATGITEMCYMPSYIYFMADNQNPPSNVTHIIEKVYGCRKSNEISDHATCFARNNAHVIKQLDLHTNTWKTTENPDNKTQVLTTNANNIISRPTITVSIAANTPPWIMFIDLKKTVDDTIVCGREGMKGARVNGSQKIEICVYGFAIDVFRSLQKHLNFDYKIMVSRDGTYGLYDKETNTSSGIVREIVENNADIALDLTETKSRSHVLWFSKSYVISGMGLMYVKSDSFSNSGIFKPFHPNLWYGFLGSVVLVILFIWIMEIISPYGRCRINQSADCDDDRTFNIVDSANYVWGTYFTGEIIVEKPRSFGSRVTIIVISIVAVVIIASYSGNLITYLLVVNEASPINGLLDEKIIGQNPTITVATPSGNAIIDYLREHSDPRYRIIHRRLILCEYDNCVNQLKRREFNVLLYDYLTLKYITDIDKDCILKTKRLQKDTGIGIVALKSWTWKRRVDAALSYMVESGEVDYFIKRWFGQESCKSSNTFYAIDILKLRDLFVILSISVLIASFILVIELAWQKIALKKNKK